MYITYVYDHAWSFLFSILAITVVCVIGYRFRNRDTAITIQVPVEPNQKPSNIHIFNNENVLPKEFTIKVNADDYHIIQGIKKTLEYESETKAVALLSEIYLAVVLSHNNPEERKIIFDKLDEILSKPEYQKLIKKEQSFWGVNLGNDEPISTSSTS